MGSNYRSSSAYNGTNAYNLNFNSSNVNPNNNNERENGLSIRCVRAFISIFQELFKLVRQMVCPACHCVDCQCNPFVSSSLCMISK
ncbi:MAG: hypothetical protein LBR26_12205 [Prevotella sp.]|nr:hypothetical protein [Prevotella sp.]